MALPAASKVWTSRARDLGPFSLAVMTSVRSISLPSFCFDLKARRISRDLSSLQVTGAGRGWPPPQRRREERVPFSVEKPIQPARPSARVSAQREPSMGQAAAHFCADFSVGQAAGAAKAVAAERRNEARVRVNSFFMEEGGGWEMGVLASAGIGGAGIFRVVGGSGFWRVCDMKSYRKELWFEVGRRRDFLNITGEVEECLRESGIREGICLVNAMHI